MKNRPLLNRFLIASAMKKKMQQEENKRMEKFYRVSKVAGIILLVLNSLLSLDVFLLPQQEVEDQVDHTEVIRTRRRRGSLGTVDYILITQNNRRILIAANYPDDPHKLIIQLTPITRMVAEVKDIDANQVINKAYDSLKIARNAAPVLLILGLLSFFIRKTMRENAVVSILYIVAALAELIVFLI